MANQIKKASLLSEADKQKLLKNAGSKKPISQTQTTTTAARPVSQASVRRTAEEQINTASSSKAKVWLYMAIVLLTLFVITPKPALLEYHSAGLTTQSIYMPGWFGQPGIILDTNQRALLAEDEQSLYLCFDGQSREQCAKYQLRQQQGMFAAALFWYSSLR
jgi:hypothetical protein